MAAHVKVSRYQRPRDAPSGRAYCQGLGCGWALDCTRSRAQEHVKRTGHTVHYTVEQISIYEPVEGP